MNKAILILVSLAAMVAAFFWGQHSGQQKALEIQSQQQALQRVEGLGNRIRYHTLLELGKADELQLLIKSRILADKTQLEASLNSEANTQHQSLIKNAIQTANTVLKTKTEQ